MHAPPVESPSPVETLAHTLVPGGMGAVLARAGVGKTALIVQIALGAMLSGRNVLHVSLEDPVTKVTLWYREIHNLLIARTTAADPSVETLESLLPRRFVMTFNAERFKVPVLAERLTDLIAQDIFTPHMLVVDGLPFDSTAAATLDALHRLLEQHGLTAWLTVRIHRHEAVDAGGMPVAVAAVADRFTDIWQILPEEARIRMICRKAGDALLPGTSWCIDPATQLITGTAA